MPDSRWMAVGMRGWGGWPWVGQASSWAPRNQMASAVWPAEVSGSVIWSWALVDSVAKMVSAAALGEGGEEAGPVEFGAVEA